MNSVYIIFSLTFLIASSGCSLPLGEPLSPQTLERLSKFPKDNGFNPEKFDFAAHGLIMHPENNINSDPDVRKELTSPDGRDMGHMTKEGSNWYIYDKSGSYVGRIDENGFITNRRGDNLGRVN